MKRLLVVGFGLAVAVAGVMEACGGDDTTGGSTGTAGTGTAGSGAAGTAGSGSGTGGTTGGTTGTGGGGSTGVGGFNFDGGFDFDALFGGNYTCADLAKCCPTLPAQAQASCNMLVQMGDNANCSIAVSGFKQVGQCN